MIKHGKQRIKVITYIDGIHQGDANYTRVVYEDDGGKYIHYGGKIYLTENNLLVLRYSHDGMRFM